LIKQLTETQHMHRRGHLVLALCGRAGAGKDALADYLVTRHGFTKAKFADPLKRAACVLFDWPPEALEGPAKDQPDSRYGGVTPRALLQWLGTSVMQHSLQDVMPGVGRGFFANRLCRQLLLRAASDSILRIVISDMRFMHEYVALRRCFGDNMCCIKITREESALHPRRIREAEHVSETEHLSIPVNLELCNDGSLVDMYATFDAWIIETALRTGQ